MQRKPKWQKIETAPKDGTRILGWDGEDVTEMCWVSIPDDDGHIGWCQSDFESGGFLYKTHNKMERSPTHWRPKPDPPEKR